MQYDGFLSYLLFILVIYGVNRKSHIEILIMFIEIKYFDEFMNKFCHYLLYIIIIGIYQKKISYNLSELLLQAKGYIII